LEFENIFMLTNNYLPFYKCYSYISFRNSQKICTKTTTGKQKKLSQTVPNFFLNPEQKKITIKLKIFGYKKLFYLIKSKN